MRRYLAWESIVAEKDTLDLSPHRVKQAETQKAAAHSTVTARIPEAYQWLLVPTQNDPQAAIQWQAMRLTGHDRLAARASKKPRTDESLVTGLGPTRLRMEMDRVPLWRSDHVAIGQLIEDFGRYLYLPRLASSAVLLNAISDGLGLLTWGLDSFALADSHDQVAGRYRGLQQGGRLLTPTEGDGSRLLAKPEVAIRQLDAEVPTPTTVTPPDPGRGGGSIDGSTPAGPKPPSVPGVTPSKKLVRYHGCVALDPERAGRDASRIAEEVITHLAGLDGATVTVTLEISEVVNKLRFSREKPLHRDS